MDEIEVLTQQAIESIWNVYPGYSRDLLDLDELVPAVRTNVELSLRVLRKEEMPDHEDLAPARRLGSRRAAQGVPLESVIQAYRSTERTMLLHLLGGTEQGSRGRVEARADLVIRTFDRLTDEMINAYRETSSTIEAARGRVEAEVIGALASGAVMSALEVQRWQDMLGIDADRPWAVVSLRPIVAADEVAVQRARRRLAVVLRAHVHGPVIFGHVGEDVVAVLSPRTGLDPLVAAIRSFLVDAVDGVWGSAGFGESSVDLRGTAASLRQARECVRVARASGARVLIYDDILPEALMTERPAVAARLVATRLGPLQDHPELLSTLEALTAAGASQTAAARSLRVHINTVGNRIRRIEALTGRHPLEPRAALEFALALMASRLIPVDRMA